MNHLFMVIPQHLNRIQVTPNYIYLHGVSMHITETRYKPKKILNHISVVLVTFIQVTIFFLYHLILDDFLCSQGFNLLTL